MREQSSSDWKKKLIYVPVTLTERSFSTETAAVKLFVD